MEVQCNAEEGRAREEEGTILGHVQETEITKHYIMVPKGVEGKLTMIKSGNFTVDDVVAKVDSKKKIGQHHHGAEEIG